MARTMLALDMFVPETKEAFLDLENGDVEIADIGYSLNVKARKIRRSAILLIEEIWKSDESYVDALIPYFAMKYYDHFASTDNIPHVFKNDAVVNENLFVIGCLITAFRQRTGDFNIPLFLEKRQLRDYSQHNVAEQVRLINLSRLTFNFNTLTPIAFSDYLVQDLPNNIWRHRPRIRCLARQLIVKSIADIEMTYYKPSIVGLSAIAAICSKLFPGLSDVNTSYFAAKLNVNSDKVSFEECLPKIMKWTTGLACDPEELNNDHIEELNNDPDIEELNNDPDIKELNNNDIDVGWTELGWTEVVGGWIFGCFEALVTLKNRCNIL